MVDYQAVAGSLLDVFLTQGGSTVSPIKDIFLGISTASVAPFDLNSFSMVSWPYLTREDKIQKYLKCLT